MRSQRIVLTTSPIPTYGGQNRTRTYETVVSDLQSDAVAAWLSTHKRKDRTYALPIIVIMGFPQRLTIISGVVKIWHCMFNTLVIIC